MMEFNTQPEPKHNGYPESWETVKEDLNGVASIYDDSELCWVYRRALALAVDVICLKEKCGPEEAIAMLKRACVDRNEFGKAKYGTPLQPFNGRDAMQDSLEEVLDLVVYLKTALLEQEMQ